MYMFLGKTDLSQRFSVWKQIDGSSIGCLLSIPKKGRINLNKRQPNVIQDRRNLGKKETCDYFHIYRDRIKKNIVQVQLN